MIKVIGIITARGGSKEVPRKKFKKLQNKPLIQYTFEAAKQSKFLSRIIISTDDHEIANIAKNQEIEVPFMRPENLATSSAKSIDVVIHALNWIKDNEGKSFDYAMILQPTSPLRTFMDIDECIIKAEQTGADSVMSMVEIVDLSLPKLKKINDGNIYPLFMEEGNISQPRNSDTPIYKRNAAIYLTKTSLLSEGNLFGTNSKAYIMPFDRSIDINSTHDFEIAEYFMGKNG